MELKILIWLVAACGKIWNGFYWLLDRCGAAFAGAVLWLVSALIWVFGPPSARQFFRYKGYPKRIRRAYDRRDNEAVKTLCAQWLEMSEREELAGLDRGHVIHETHTFLGLVALRENDLEAAKNHLLVSGNIESSPTLEIKGPWVSLAAWLLRKGEREVVVAFLDSVEKWWASGSQTPSRRRELRQTLREWKKDARAGRLPNDARWR